MPRKANTTVGSEFHRNCHKSYVPKSVRTSKQQGPHNMRYEQYIEMGEDSEDSYKRKKGIREEASAKSKRDQEVKEEINIPKPEEAPERVVECFIERNYVNNPVIVDEEAKKPAAPIKKINFTLPGEKPMNWNDYHELKVIHNFLDQLESDFPSLCTTGVIGTSIEGRSLKILKISNSNASNASVWVDAGIHAREWIAPAVNTYIADHISRHFDELPESIKNKDWYFLPVVNPDGYEYTHTTDRMWRKNRAWHGNHCVGVDLNRNFSIGWGGRGSSDQPSNAFYRGPHPFSEPESSAIRDLFIKSGIKFKVYITLHSYGQIIIFPYACSSQLAPDYVRLLEGATAMSKAIYNTNGNTYKVGISRDVMYGAAGTSNDFAHGAAGIPYCYLIELRSKKHKFKLPKEEIEETGNEILNCVKALMEFVDSYTYNKRPEESVVDIPLEAKNDSLLKSHSHVQRSDSQVLIKNNTNLKKRESYDKKTYSFVKSNEDTSTKKSDSFVRWTNLPVKTEDSLEKSGDAKSTGSLLDKNKSFENAGDSSMKQTDSFFKNTEFSETEAFMRKADSFGQSYSNKSDFFNERDSFLHLNDSFMKKTECFKNVSDSFLKKTESGKEDTVSILKKTQFFNDNSDSFYQKTEYFKDNSDSFLKKTKCVKDDSVSILKKTDFFKDDSDSFLKKSEYFKDNSDSFFKKTDCFKDESDSFLKKTHSYIQKTDCYMTRTDSYPSEFPDVLFETSSNSFKQTGGKSETIVKVAPPVPNTQVWEVKLIREGQRRFVKALDTTGAINIWKEERSTMDILVNGPRAAQVAGMLHERDIPYSVAIPDVTTMLEKEQGINSSRTIRRTSTGSRKVMDWKNYHRLDTIYAFMDNLVAEFPYLCSVSVIGKSVEGRDMKMLKISNGNGGNSGVWLDGAIHPREWISPAVVTYIADRIVRTFNEQPDSVTNKDWYVLPVMNPDGYEYTHTHDRMWRKNRAHYGECVGVDLNRNFSYGFAEKGEEGSSDDPGNVFYRGPKAFSEPETSAVRRVILESPTTFKVFLSFHSYGEVIIFPWGYTSEPCPDYVELLEGGTAMAKAIFSTSGQTYKVGSTKDLMYYAAGTSIDWSYAVTNIPYSYMIELRGKKHRFLLPKEEILTTATEVYNGVMRLMDFVDRRCAGTQSCACPK